MKTKTVRYNGGHMVVAFFSWWYSTGWQLQSRRISSKLAELSDFFSISLLARTLFAPFRQISVGAVQGPLGVQLQAFFDKLISRCIGALLRSVMILVGIVALGIYCLWAVMRLSTWPLLPIAPLIGVILSVVGWTPWS